MLGTLFGQTPLNFERYGIEDGLPVQTVRSLAIDTFGYLWVGTRGGLARFDGKDMVAYEFNPDRPEGLKVGGIVEIVPVGTRYLAFMAVDQTLYLIDRGNGELTYYPIVNEETGADRRNFSLTYLNNDTLYLGVQQLGLVRFDLREKKFYFPDSTTLQAFGEGATITATERSSANGLWMVNVQGYLGHYEPATGRMQLLQDKPINQLAGKTIGTIKSLTEGVDGSIWYGYLNDGLGRFHPKTGQVVQYAEKGPPLSWNYRVGVEGIIPLTNGEAWIKSPAQPYRYNPGANSFTGFPVLVDNEPIPKSWHSMRAIQVDTSKRRLWLGGTGGLFVADLPGAATTESALITTDTSQGGSIQYVSRTPSLPSFALGSDGKVRWRSLTAKGWSSARIANGTELPAAEQQLFFATDTSLWYATAKGAQIVCYNWSDKSLISYDRPVALSSGINDLEVIKKDLIYLGTNSGLIAWTPSSGETKEYRRSSFYQIAKNDPLYAPDIALDSAGMLWFVNYDGAIRVNPEKLQQFSRHAYQPDQPNSLSYTQGFHLVADHLGGLWIGTDVGLNRHVGEGKFDRLLPDKGLPHKQVIGLWPASQGGVWVMTQLGLGFALADASRVIPIPSSTSGCSTIDQVLGLLDGNRLVVSACGNIEVVSPPVTDTVQQALQITGIKYYQGKTDRFLRYTEWRNGQSLQLSHLDNSLEVSFAPVGLLGDGPFTYQYRFLGLQDKWSLHGQERLISMAGFSPGKYELQVKTSQRNLAPPLRIPILVAYPWYRRTWFYALFTSLLLVGIVLGYRRWQIRRAEVQDREFQRFQSELYGNIAHELRTPLTLIQAQSSEIDKGIEPPERIRKNINRHVGSMLTLIDQLLRIDQLREARHIVVRQEGNIFAQLRESAQQFSLAATEAGIDLRVDLPEEPLIIRYSDYAWKTIINNLLSNAIKYSDPGDSVMLSASYEKEHLIVEITDTGPGIPEEKKTAIFTRYARLKKHHKKMGNGIGLAYVATVLEEIGGMIRVEDNPPRGSQFIVSLPCQPIRLATEPMGLPQSNSRKALPLVLVIEDHHEMADYVTKCLQDQYRVLQANTGTAGLELAMAEVPNAIVTDLMLPGMDGIEITRRLKAERLTSHIPVILLTARSLQESRLAGLRAGADAYLTKPFDPEELRARLSNQLAFRLKLSEHFFREARQARPQVQRNVQKAVAKPTPEKVDQTPPTQNLPGQLTRLNQLPAQEIEFLEEVKGYVLANLDRVELNAEVLAPLLTMSRTQLYRKLQALTGLSVNLYLRKIRLDVAAKRLQKGTESIQEIAYATGFSSPKYMSRLFREAYGVSPRAYRQREG